MGRFTPIAKGGYAQVHLTKHEGKDCIRKVLNDDLVISVNEFKRFQREYRILKELDHPSIIKVFEVDGNSYIMEKADSDLENYILDNDLSSGQIDQIIDGIVSGLKELHLREIIHRDLKPENILMVGDTPKIADLGICKPINSATIHTDLIDRDGLGTLAYMSRAHQNGREPNFHFDIFALGRVIYFMESKEHPPIGTLSLPSSLRNKALILATESEEPIQVPNIDIFMNLRERQYKAIFHSPSTAIQEYLQNKIGISELVAIFEKSTKQNNYEPLNNSFNSMYERVLHGDNTSLSLLYNMYSKEFEKFRDQPYWPFEFVTGYVTNVLQLHEKCNNDELNKKILIEAFKFSYENDQWGAKKVLDRYVRKRGGEFFNECLTILSVQCVKDSSLGQFMDQNG